MWQAYFKQMDYRVAFILPAYFLIVSGFSLLSVFHQNWELFWGLAVFDGLLLIAFVYLLRFGLSVLGKAMMVGINFFFIAFLIVQGGHEQTGYFWTFPILVSFIHVLGGMTGALMALIALLFIRMLEAEGWAAMALSSRFYFAALALIFLAAIHEHSLERHRRHLSHKISVKQTENSMDPLTGVGNRRLVDQTLDLLYRSKSHDMVGVLVVDLDNFKTVNDSEGHAKGDEVLKRVATHLTASIRPTDEVARWGGDEFVIFLYNVSLDAAEMVAYRIQQAVLNDKPLKELDISVSIGGALTTHDYRRLFTSADDNLLYVKEKGKNQFYIRLI